MTDAEKKAHAREVLTQVASLFAGLAVSEAIHEYRDREYPVVMATDWVRGRPNWDEARIRQADDGLLVELRNRDGTRQASHLAVETMIALHGLPIKEQPE